ncbi:MAG: hypothetical protein KKD44_26800 [Proteobacteria bacterium]|nr:hypothetical protein [Pseudomonadota bacterium]
MMDNFHKLPNLLTFESEDDFYYLQILQRKSEHPELGSNSKVIRNYFINSIEYLNSHESEIKAICDTLNARACLRLNKRSYRRVAFKTMVNLANTMANNTFNHCYRVYDKTCGQGHNHKPARWIVDIDTKMNKRELNEIVLFIDRKCDPIKKEYTKFVTVLDSKKGYHLIMHPFNVMQFKQLYPEIEIHKDNPSNCYIP